MGNQPSRSATLPPPAMSHAGGALRAPRESTSSKVRGALGVDEFLLLHHATQQHLLAPELVWRRLQSHTPISKSAFLRFFGLSYDAAFAEDFYHYACTFSTVPDVVAASAAASTSSATKTLISAGSSRDVRSPSSSHGGGGGGGGDGPASPTATTIITSSTYVRLVTFKALTDAVAQLCTGRSADRIAAMFHLFSRGADSVDRAGLERITSTLFTMYSLLGIGAGRLDADAADSAAVAAASADDVTPADDEDDAADASSGGVGGGGGDGGDDGDAQRKDWGEAVRSATTPSMLQHVVASALEHAASFDVSLLAFQKWLENDLRCAADLLATHFHQLFLETPEAEADVPRDLLRRPTLSAPTRLLLPADVLALSLVSHRMQRHEWDLLYSSDADGLSFNRMTYGIGGYDGPLLFVLQNDAGQVFGAFAGERLKESPEFQGNALSFLFSLRPTLGVFRPTAHTNGHFVYFNTRGSDGPHGLGFGGDRAAPPTHTGRSSHGGGGGDDSVGHRLWLNTDLDDCRVREGGSGCYVRGRLAEPLADTETSFNVAAIEVWGLGGEVGMVGRDRFRRDNAKMFDDIKTIKPSTKLALAGDMFNQQMFLSRTYQRNAAASGGSL